MAIRLSDRQKTAAILIGVAVVAYFAYRWWKGRQGSQDTTGTGEGSNLNSVAPSLVGGSQGPDSGITYDVPPPTINVTEPAGGTSGVPPPSGGGGGTPPPPPPKGVKPTKLSATGHKGFLDVGFTGTPSAKYDIKISGTGGFSKTYTITGTHDRINLKPGTYEVQVESLGGPWVSDAHMIKVT